MQTDSKIQCAICGKSYHIISPTHLKKSHKLTMAEYRKLYPGAPITSEKQKSILIKGNISKSRKQKEEKIDFECEWCGEISKVSKVSKRKYCSVACSNNAKKGIGLSNSVKRKISQRVQEKKDKEKHPWEQIISEANRIPDWLIEIYEELSKNYNNIKFKHKIPNGNIVDIAFLDNKIGVNFLNSWSGYPSIRPEDSESVGWACCDVFTQNPKKAIHVLAQHISSVGKCPSIKTPDFRYVSSFYNQYKESINNSLTLY